MLDPHPVLKELMVDLPEDGASALSPERLAAWSQRLVATRDEVLAVQIAALGQRALEIDGVSDLGSQLMTLALICRGDLVVVDDVVDEVDKTTRSTAPEGPTSMPAGLAPPSPNKRIGRSK